MTASIAILCPSRGRPELCKRMIQSAYSTSSGNIQIFLAVSQEEFEEYTKTIEIPASDRFGVCIVVYPDFPTVHKWNRLAELAMTQPNSLFMLGADDMVFTTPLWDKALTDNYEGQSNKIHVYALQDSRDENGTPHPIVTREYIEAMGWFLPPIFLHWFVDSWTVEIAKTNDCFTHLRNYMLEHIKPSDTGRSDETHDRIRRNGWHERDKWVSNKCHDYLLDEKNRLGKIMQS